MDVKFIFSQYIYWTSIILMAVGFYIAISRGNLIRRLIGLNLFQVSVFIFYIAMGKAAGGTAPILTGRPEIFSNPLPQVLILTAIVVGVSATALGLALAVRIHNAWGTIEEDKIDAIERAQAQQDARTQ